MQTDKLIKALRNFGAAGLATFALLLLAPAHGADEAVPIVVDVELEERVQELSYKLRCLVCQNESVAESRAPLAVDLRNQVREQLAAGKSEDEVIDFLVARYGDFVLYLPPFKATTFLLWFGPALLLVGGVGGLLFRLRRRAAEAAPHLSDEERACARELLAAGAPVHSEEPRK